MNVIWRAPAPRWRQNSARTHQSSSGPNHAAARRFIGVAGGNDASEGSDVQQHLFATEVTVVTATGERLDGRRDPFSGLLRKIAGEKADPLGSQRFGLRTCQPLGVDRSRPVHVDDFVE